MVQVGNQGVGHGCGWRVPHSSTLITPQFRNGFSWADITALTGHSSRNSIQKILLLENEIDVSDDLSTLCGVYGLGSASGAQKGIPDRSSQSMEAHRRRHGPAAGSVCDAGPAVVGEHRTGPGSNRRLFQCRRDNACSRATVAANHAIKRAKVPPARWVEPHSRNRACPLMAAHSGAPRRRPPCFPGTRRFRSKRRTPTNRPRSKSSLVPSVGA